MWISVLLICTSIFDKFHIKIFLWITLRFETIYTQLYPEIDWRTLSHD